MAGDVEVYAEGLCCASVCASADLSPEEVARRVNAERPTGTGAGWRPSGAARFLSGEPNPCPCERHPATRRHLLLEC